MCRELAYIPTLDANTGRMLDLSLSCAPSLVLSSVCVFGQAQVMLYTLLLRMRYGNEASTSGILVYTSPDGLHTGKTASLQKEICPGCKKSVSIFPAIFSAVKASLAPPVLPLARCSHGLSKNGPRSASPLLIP